MTERRIAEEMNAVNIVSLRDYFDEKVEANERAMVLALENLNVRLHAMNEFRSAMKDQAANFITRQEHEFVMADIRSLRESRAEISGKASQVQFLIVFILSVSGIIISILNIFKLK